MNLDPRQRARLRRAKLVALASDLGTGPVPAADGGVDAGAAVVAALDGAGWAHLESGDAGSLAAALLWAVRGEVDPLVVFVDDSAAVAARLAGHLDPQRLHVQVREVLGRTSRPAVPAPLPPPEPEAPLAEAEPLVDLLRAEGLEVVVEHGVIRGEVHGLEVARIVRWDGVPGSDGALHLEAGVGRFDRDAVAAVHPDEHPVDSLSRTVEMVRRHRHHGATTHPVSLLARSRWLRSDVVADPGAVGAEHLRAVGMTTEPSGLRDDHPAAALGVDSSGREMLVVCSTGFDPALVPLAADTRAWLAPDGRLLLVVPERDLHAATVSLAELTVSPAELATVVPGWS